MAYNPKYYATPDEVDWEKVISCYMVLQRVRLSGQIIDKKLYFNPYLSTHYERREFYVGKITKGEEFRILIFRHIDRAKKFMNTMTRQIRDIDLWEGVAYGDISEERTATHQGSYGAWYVCPVMHVCNLAEEKEIGTHSSK